MEHHENDDGDVDDDLDQKIQRLVSEEQVLAAARLLKQHPCKCKEQQYLKLLSNAEIMENAIKDLLSSPQDNEEWIKQGESHGKNGDFTIYYKIEDGAKLTCRIESPISTSHLVPLLSVLNESELYQEWIPTFHRPFKLGVTSSKQLATFSRVHQVIQVQCSVPYPISPREALFDVVAIDDIDENGFIMAKMTTVTEELVNNLPSDEFVYPGITSGFTQCDFNGAVLFRACPKHHPNYDTAKQKLQDCGEDGDLILTTFTFHFDAKLRYIPQALINFVTKEAIGVIWKMLLHVAEQVLDGTRKSHCEAIAQKRELYAWIERRCLYMLQQIRNKDQQCTTIDKTVRMTPTSSTNVTIQSCRTEKLTKEEEKYDEGWTMQDICRLNA